jgi:hypothetical protein
MKSQRNECILHISYDATAWLRPAAAAMEMFGILYTNEGIFFAVSPEFPYFHISVRLVNSSIN